MKVHTQIFSEDICVNGDSIINTRTDWASWVFHTLMETPKVNSQLAVRIINALLVAWTDFGLRPPSTQATRNAASCGVGLPQALSAGLLCFGDTHAPIQAAAEHLLKCAGVEEPELIPGRVPGLGHPVLEVDPRVQPLFDLLPNGVSLHVNLIKNLGEWNDQPVNLAGATAALWLDMGFGADTAAFCAIIGRSLGLTMHYADQRQNFAPLTIPPTPL